jgi:hypothetical protein
MQVWRQGRVRTVERVDDAVVADRLVLTHLDRLGCDATLPRECRHYLYLPREIGARAVAQAVEASDGWCAEVEDVHGCWLVTANVVTALSDAGVRETRAWLHALAAEHGGEYDGWEAAAD